MKIVLTILFLLSTHLLSGQNIVGRILDAQTHDPIEYVNVAFQKDHTGAASDRNGIFRLVMKPALQKNDTLEFSAVGYATQKMTYSALAKNDFTILLEKKVEAIGEVTVHSRRLKTSLKYTRVASMKAGISSFGSAIMNGKLYIVGGDLSSSSQTFLKAWRNTNDRIVMEPTINTLNKELIRSDNNISVNQFSNKIRIYDLKNNTWIAHRIKIEDRASGKVIPYKDKLYILGGKTMSESSGDQLLSNTIDVYDTTTQKVEVDHTTPHQAVNFASVRYNNYIIVMGGSTKVKKDGKKVFTDQSHLYNLETGHWFELPDMPEPKETNGVVAGDKIYLIGGFDGSPLSEIDSYDMFSGKWKKEGNLPQAIANPALAVHDSTIYIFNYGKLFALNTQSKLLQEYNISILLKDSQLQYYHNSLYVIGGRFEDKYDNKPSTEIYKIDLNELKDTKSKFDDLKKTSSST